VGHAGLERGRHESITIHGTLMSRPSRILDNRHQKIALIAASGAVSLQGAIS
jgi:hypothetical protein